MTIEIKQLIIRAVVEDRRERPTRTGGIRSRSVSEPVRHAAPADIARQVLRELQRGRGR